MSKTIEVVRQRSSILQATLTHGVPLQTLQDQIFGRVTHGYSPGPKPCLSQTEEKDLADFLVETSQVGYGKSRQQIKGYATLAMCDKGLLKVERNQQMDGITTLWEGSHC